MSAPADETDLRIVIVGPCGAGKSTLADGLCMHEYNAHQITQEHSFVPDMWKLISKPDILVYLDASFEACNQRKQLDWGPKDHAEQVRRLAHAREHCDIYLNTDGMTPEGVLVSVLQSLKDVKS